MTPLNHDGLLQMKERHPDWIWNRSDNHVILGEPESPEAFKTIVEPGNSFSPGFRSYGVSVWARVDGRAWAPEAMRLEDLHWSYADGFLPILRCQWKAGAVTITTEVWTEGDLERRSFRTHLSVTLENDGPDVLDATAYVLVRSFGAAGAPVRRLAFRDRDVLVNGAVAMTFDVSPDTAVAVSYDEHATDVGQLLLGGEDDGIREAEDASSWASGAAGFTRSLAPGESSAVAATCFVHAGSDHLSWLRRPEGLPFERPDREGFLERWRAILPMRLDLPDGRFADALRAQANYLAMATVGVEPRISPISYPLWWLRDGAYTVNALDKAGYAAWTDRAVRSVAARTPFGGFGAEGDGPGELIWIMTEHWLLTGDDDFLREVMSSIRRNADLIVRMRHTTVPIFGKTEIRTPQMMFSDAADLMCRPARDGLIDGRMDGHFPRFWVNGWAWFGLRRAVLAGRALGEDTSEWEREADEQLAAITRLMPGNFGENDRDVTGSIWPTGYADPEDPEVRAVFDRFWSEVRYPGGVHHPEPEWTYFEAGQAHNNVLLGLRERAWVSIDHFLTNSTAPGLYTQHEGIGDENSSLQWQRSRGWDHIPHVTPHGWTAAELLLLLRDCLLRETREGELVIGSGIPAAWLEHDFSFAELPSHFGAVSVHWSTADRVLTVTTEREVPGGVRHELLGEAAVAHRRPVAVG